LELSSAAEIHRLDDIMYDSTASSNGSVMLANYK